MSDPNFVLLYVFDPLTAADFFAERGWTLTRLASA